MLVVHASSERLYSVERGVVYSLVVFTQILSGGSLCGSPVRTSGLEILLYEGEDVELCARTSKHIRVFAFDRLSLTLSLSTIVPCIIHIVIHSLYAWLICVCLTCA